MSDTIESLILDLLERDRMPSYNSEKTIFEIGGQP